MRRWIRGALDATPYVGRLRAQVRALRRAQGRHPPGHFYSPIPSPEDVARSLAALEDALPLGIDLDEAGQAALLEEFAALHDPARFPETPTPGRRFHFAQNYFGQADAIFLDAFLRRFRPRRVVEVGSGFSTAVMLDARDGGEAGVEELVCVEPYPERLLSPLAPGDAERMRIEARPVQEAPLETFTRLEAGDLLFIDSSHVMKCGSDLHHLMFEVPPRLEAGVFVHFHDILYPFRYPQAWPESGVHWNESYVLRAFLMGNRDWRVRFWNNFVVARHRKVLVERIPLALRNAGGSLYLEKLAPPAGRDG